MIRGLLAFLVCLILWTAPWRLFGVLAELPFVDVTTIRSHGGQDRYWDVQALNQRLAEQGWTVHFTDLTDYGYAGRTQFETREIWVDSTESWDERLATLAHEAGHTGQPNWSSHTGDEAFAELVATVIAKDGLREHARYLARMKADAFLVALTEWRRIYRVAREMDAY